MPTGDVNVIIMPNVMYLILEGLLRAVSTLDRANSAGGLPVLDNAAFPWLRRFAAEFMTIRDESLQLLETLQPADSQSVNAAPVGVDGVWRLVPLFDRRGPYPYADRLPRTMTTVCRVPNLRAADLAILHPHSTIHAHSGNNWGVLRGHLTLVEPLGAGDCHLRFTDANVVVHWREGEAFVFDDMHRHEAVNTRASSRLVLLFEFDRPLSPVCVRWLNALVQRWYRHHPVQRGVRERVISNIWESG